MIREVAACVLGYCVGLAVAWIVLRLEMRRLRRCLRLERQSVGLLDQQLRASEQDRLLLRAALLRAGEDLEQYRSAPTLRSCEIAEGE